jgi:hypothetical protein
MVLVVCTSAGRADNTITFLTGYPQQVSGHGIKAEGILNPDFPANSHGQGAQLDIRLHVDGGNGTFTPYQATVGWDSTLLGYVVTGQANGPFVVNATYDVKLIAYCFDENNNYIQWVSNIITITIVQ